MRRETECPLSFHHRRNHVCSTILYWRVLRKALFPKRLSIRAVFAAALPVVEELAIFRNMPTSMGYATDQPLIFTTDPNVTDPGSIALWSIRFDFLQYWGQNPPMFSLTTGGGGVTIQDGPTRQFTALVSAAQSSSTFLVNPMGGEYFYRVYRTDLGASTLMAYGEITVRPP